MKLLIVLSCALASVSAFHPSTINLANYDNRITNGTAASEGQFPYQVRLTISSDGLNFILCGGSLISQTWVLTAAHCTDGASIIYAYLGGTTTSNAEVTYTIYSNDTIIHSDYQQNDVRNDISLIKIPETRLTEKIQIVPLPSISLSNQTYLDKYAIASGWGRTSDLSENTVDWLQWTRLRIVDSSVCENLYYNFDGKMKMCVSTSGGSSTCNGDSGGPFVLESEQILIGLTSFGLPNGCEIGNPIGFTRVTRYLNWIEYHTGIAYY